MDAVFSMGVHCPDVLLDLVDAKWMADILSDDDIELPAGLDSGPAPNDDHFGVDLGEHEPGAEDLKWNDLDLDQYGP